MVNLKRASNELFSRTPDEFFPSLSVLEEHCQSERNDSEEIWQPPGTIVAKTTASLERLSLSAGSDKLYQLNDWSFGQLCRLAHVSKDTVNRLSPDTAARVFSDTLPTGTKPLQFYLQSDRLRSLHAATYTRLYNADVVGVIREFATDFQPPPSGVNGATGLYCGEQDTFCFLIDPTGWAEIDGEAFAPGFFVWNSEVGSRSVGIQTFWFQSVCQNHIVWDATEITEFSRKHTANVQDALTEIRRIIEALVEKRDKRRDGFVKVIRSAMQTTLAESAEETERVLAQNGIPRKLAKEATLSANRLGRFTVFSLVDALTRLTGAIANAADRTALDERASRLLTLAA